MPRKAAPKPDNWNEVLKEVDAGRMTMRQAADSFGISESWLYRLRHKENPGRKDRRHEMGRKVGCSRKRYTTLMERDFSDYLMCKAIKAIDKCERCPKHCGGQKQYRGLINALLERVPLNGDENISEKT